MNEIQQKTLDDLTEFDDLIKEIIDKKNRIIPIIGDDCFVGYKRDNNQIVPLQRWIAEELLGKESTEETKNKIYSEGYYGLDLLFKEYHYVKNKSFVQFKAAVIKCISNGITSERLILRKDIKEFLLAGRFNVIVTTCPYHILENEMLLSKKKYNVSSFSPKSSKVVSEKTSSSDVKSKSEMVLELPSIYMLFGDCEGDFVHDEDSLLRFLHYLNQTDTEKGFGASPLVKYIKNNFASNKGIDLLMPIGCSNLPNWLFRFLWYPFSQDLLFGKDNNNEGGIWPNYCPDRDFYKFLIDYNFQTLSDPVGSDTDENIPPDPILIRLTTEFKKTTSELEEYATKELNVKWRDEDTWDLFLSYASDDKDLALEVYDILTNICNQSVWMDSRGGIKPGEKYWNAIQYGIEHSRKIVYLITSNYLNKANDRNHQYDWGKEPTGVYKEIKLIEQYLISQKMVCQKGFSVPLVMNDTKITYTDSELKLHKDEIIKNGMIEKLHTYNEYDKLQTELLFKETEDILCSRDNLRENLEHIFKR